MAGFITEPNEYLLRDLYFDFRALSDRSDGQDVDNEAYAKEFDEWASQNITNNNEEN